MFKIQGISFGTAAQSGAGGPPVSATQQATNHLSTQLILHPTEAKPYYTAKATDAYTENLGPAQGFVPETLYGQEQINFLQEVISLSVATGPSVNATQQAASHLGTQLILHPTQSRQWRIVYGTDAYTENLGPAQGFVPETLYGQEKTVSEEDY